MRYRRYEVEDRYRRLQEVAEPVDFRGRGFDAFDLRPFLDEVLPKLTIPGNEPWAFEYGTGTGPSACYLAERGFRVDAIDTSPAAIELAKRFAAEKGLIIGFEVGDIVRLSGWDRTYDLVVDSFCMHNLITDDERRRALANVRALLRLEAYFVIGTRFFDPERAYGHDIRDEGTGIVYSPLEANPEDFEDVRRIDGAWYYARARHVRPAELREEIEVAGFRVLCQRNGGRIVCTRDARAEPAGAATDESRRRDSLA